MTIEITVKGSKRSTARAGVGAAMLSRAARLTTRWAGRPEDLQLVALGAFTWIGIQWFGRSVAQTEWDDLNAMALVALVLWLALGREPKRFPEMSDRFREFAAGLGARTKAKLSAAWPRIGVDLVEEPPFPRGLPPIFWMPGIAIAALGLMFALRPWAAGLDLVATGRQWVYPVYLAATGTFWLIALAVGIFGLVLPFALIRNWASSTYRDHDQRRTHESRRAMLITFGLMAVSCLFFPASWAPSAVGFLALGTIALLHHPKQPTLAVIWRPRQGAERHRSADWRTLQSIETMFLAGVCALLMTVPAVGSISEVQRELAPISAALRWLVCLGGMWLALSVAIYRCHFALSVSFGAPSQRSPRRIRVQGGSELERATASAQLERDGWAVLEAGTGPVRSDDTLLRLDSDAPLESPHFADLTGGIAPALLEDPEIHWRLKRRSDIRARRCVTKGLKAIFKEAASGLRGPGSGFIVAPHQWFMLGLARDIADHDTTEDRSVEGFLQPEYRAVMSPRARHHLYLVLQSAGVDLIYVEDGVGYRRLAQALRVIFELFDKHGVDRRVSSRDFAAVHGVHAIVHDVTPDAPRKSETYPEPDYESETRARILHLYRDRGGSEEFSDAPVETDGIPLLV